MSSRRKIALLAGLFMGWAGLASRPLAAQTTTGTIGGTVTGDQGQPIEDAQIQVVNPATGFSRGVRSTAAGRYSVPGLEVGSGYTVTIRRIGYTSQTRAGVLVTLGQTTRNDFQLLTQATVLGEVTTTASRDALISPTRTSVSTTVSDTALRRLPSLNRNFTDFASLTPQISASGPGLSGGGTNNRYNSIQIDGASESDLFGLGSTGQPGGQANGKSIGIESVKEYQVLLAPFDVRQGNFAGALINAVTKSGTNEFHGSLVGVTRNQGFTRPQPYITKYDQSQYGFSVGGPIIKDKAFFFFNPEWQIRKLPASGDYIGLPTTNLRQTTLDSVNALISGYGLPTGGGGLVNNENPLQNVFGRLDFNLPGNNQLVLRHNYGYATDDNFSRSPSNFRLTNNAYAFKSTKNASVIQLRTLFGAGMYNELLVNRTSIRDRRAPAVAQTPALTIIVPGYTLLSGSERSSQGNELDQDMVEATDNFTIPLGAHRVTLGSQNQFYKVRNLFGQNSYGFWTFGTIDSLRQGRARTYQVGVPFAGTDGAVRFHAAAYSAYLQDEWAATNRLNITYGLRVDMPVFKDKPPFTQSVLDSVGRNTSDIPSGNLEYSPRFGFNWNATGDDRNQLRGGTGLFSGRPAFVWLSNAFQNSGNSGFAQLSCAAAIAPVFNAANAKNPPTSCTNGSTAALGGEIDLLDPNLKFPQNWRSTLGYDRRLAENWVGTLEGIYTKGIHSLFYRNLALKGIQGTDSQGRTIYGLTPGNPVRAHTNRDRVFDVTNGSGDYSYQLTGGLQRKYAGRYEGSVFYTYSRVFDVQALTSSTASSQITFGRPWGGDLLSQEATRSIFEQRHRIVAQGTYSFPTKTDLTLLYFGESGAPYDYTTNADLNGEGFSANDPLYIPKNALDPTEIVFQSQTYGGVAYTAQQQADAFQRFIEATPCLRNNRGRIVPRNSCENPWTNRVNVSGRQSLPSIMGQNLTFQVDVFNFLNLLNSGWGAQPIGGSFQLYNLLDYRGRTGSTATPASTLLNSQPIFSFNPGYKKFLSNNLSSNYQIQAQIRYSF